jgi:tetratricopeptide (TPR) repeat protein
MRFTRRTLGYALVFVLTAGCSRNAEYYIEKGNQASTAGRDTDAILNFRKAIQKNPQSGQAYFRMGLALERQSNLGEAYSALQQAVRLLPGSDEAKIELAGLCVNIYAADRRHPTALYSQASSLADQLVAANANSFDGLRLKGGVALLDKRFDAAIEWFRKADQVKPGQANVILPLSRSLFETNKTDEAEKFTLQLIATQKSVEPAYDLLYALYVKGNRAADAEKILQRKVENIPHSAGPRLQLAAHYARLKKRSEMAQTLQPVLDNPKDFPKGRLQVGDFYNFTGASEEALAQYQEGLKSNSPDKLLFQKRAAATLVRLGNRDAAFKMVEAALQEHPADDELKTIKAALLVSTRKPENIDTATSIFRELSKEKPNDPIRRLNLGRAAMLKGDLATANSELLVALKGMPTSIQIRSLLADINLLKRNHSEALRLADEILERDPANAGARLVRSASLLALGRYKEARPEIDKALAAQPKSTEAQLQLGSLDLAEGRVREAEDVFRKSYQDASGDLRPLEGLLAAEIEQKRSDNALRVIDQELAKTPDSIPLRTLLAGTAMRTGNLDLAIEQYRQVAVRQPGIGEPYLQLGEALRAGGDYEQALVEFQKAGQLSPKDVRPKVSVAALEVRMGRNDAARDSFREALAIQPDDPFIMNDLAYLVLETGGNPREALELVQSALKKKPQQPNFQDTLGSIYQKTGQTASALQVFNNLVRQYPDSPTFRYHLAVSLVQKGDRAKAREALNAALTQKPAGRLDSDIRQLLSKLN